MCGVVGIISAKQNFTSIDNETARALANLQHRGQDSFGITVGNNKETLTKKWPGLVQEGLVDIELTNKNKALGHVRYYTAGDKTIAAAQPFTVSKNIQDAITDFSLVHNGNLTNYEQILKTLSLSTNEIPETKSDSELLLSLFVHKYNSHYSAEKSKIKIIQETIKDIHDICRGSFSVIVMIPEVGLVAFKDPYGIRPLSLGKKEDGNTWMVASESVALDDCHYNLLKEITAGSAVIIQNDGKAHEIQVTPQKSKPCIFEFIYFAHRNSIINGLSVELAREKMGNKLGEIILQKLGPYESPNIDIVVPVPETAVPSAESVAKKIDCKLVRGLIRNEEAKRTFIASEDQNRSKLVSSKFTIDVEAVKGKKVLVVDDSIVRGTTSKVIVKMLLEAGAKEVYFASVSPKITHPNKYGIHLPTKKELISSRYSDDELAMYLGATDVIFPDLEAITHSLDSNTNNFELSMFTGKDPNDDREYMPFFSRYTNDKPESSGTTELQDKILSQSMRR